MAKRLFLFALFLSWLLVANAPGRTMEVGKVPMPQLSPLQWELLRQQQGGHFQPLRIDVNLAFRFNKVLTVSVRRGTGHGDVDKTIVKWIESNWTFYPWFGGGDHLVISMNVDPAMRKVVFRRI
jgi:hypothetical protein